MTPAQRTGSGSHRLRLPHRLRRTVNLLNGTTAAGLVMGRTAGLRLRRGPAGILLAGGWTHRLPHAAAFTVGNVVIYRSRVSAAFEPSAAGSASPLLRHEARHTSQYAVLGWAFLPLYFAAAGISRLRSGDPASANIFEILAGLDDGGYRSAGAGAQRPAGPCTDSAQRG
ncbi:hypothetical protein H9639_11230 [Arthrobacter sp. Sa2CUA1]|uniref:DUF4157 domain-containing protein n=1 Tax=Arthrobacter gallicola TaxID=2762225 RepID=A0ABR8UTK0_9MICC|nr:hypothetical protein [Arthrobacter gallicola]MBD7995870.1 hypothetical protein [Arthrobacter gallicola]